MTLDDSQQAASNPAPFSVRIHNHGDGVFFLRMANRADHNKLSAELAGQLLQAINTVRNEAALKVLVLEGAPDGFARGGREHVNAALSLGLFQAIASFPYPVIASMQGEALGAGFLLGALSDFMVCSETANYRYTHPETGLFPTAQEDGLFSKRFGQVRSADFLYWSQAPTTGKQLREKKWSCIVVPEEKVEERARALAFNLAKKPQLSLRLLKQHLGREVLELASALMPIEAEADAKRPVTRIVSPSKRIHLDTPASKVLALRIRHTKKKFSTSAVAKDLAALFSLLQKNTGHHAIVLSSDYPNFLPEPEHELPLDALREMQRVLLQAPLPVIIAMNASAGGKAWFFSQFSDAAVYQQEGIYSADSLLHAPVLAGMATYIFSHRLGKEAARDILLTGGPCTGQALREAAGPVLVASDEQSLAEALRRAGSWAEWPSEAVRSWKADTNRRIGAAIACLPAEPAVPDAQDGESIFATGPIELASPVVSAVAHPGGIVEVTMQDRESKNMFSPGFIEGMGEVFAHIDARPDVKVVILSGYDKYFATGGTLEALVAIQEGALQFTDDRTFRLALDCRVPVIAAMQGHAIGAGLSMGLFADFPLFSEESKYLSPYMNYGFTPGVGATLVVPEKMALDLARETLLTAMEYDGSELKLRGMPLAVYPRKQMRNAAMQLAQRIARNSRSSLMLFKHHLNGLLRDRLDDACERELAMHEQTFVGQAETLKQIQTSFIPADVGSAPIRTKDVESASAFLERDRDALRDHVPAPILSPVSLAEPETVQESRVLSECVAQPESVTLPEIAAVLKHLLAQELHLEDHEVDEHTQYTDLGLDSITGVTWMRKVNQQYGLSLDATIVYSYPTLTRLARHVQELIENRGAAHSMPDFAELEAQKLGNRETVPATTGAAIHQASSVPAVALARVDDAPLAASIGAASIAPARLPLPQSPVGQLPVRELVSWRKVRPAPSTPYAPTVSTAVSVRSTAESAEPIAVIGMAGQFPAAKNLDEFWHNLAQGKDCISEIPSERWDLGAYYQAGAPAEGKTNSKWMGLLEEYDQFDPLFFNISPVEARAMDPQQRLFLQACWHSIEHAGYNPKALAGSKCGVFVGCAANDYGMLSRKAQLSAHGFTGNASSILTARISYYLDLQGPCIAVDTACSASLVAIASACDSLRSGASDLALAGGVYVGAGPAMHIMTSQSGMLSTDGKCYTFDHRANGFVPGEAVGVVVLKRLSDAERDGDIIHAVVEGWGVNQDGKTNGITAPSPESQARLIQDVYRRFGIDPAEIQMVEAHGTGTALGDPIEIRGLKESFKAFTGKTAYCALGSVKSNIGHCLTAAGVTAFIKAVLALKHRQLPPTIHFERLNPHISLANSPFYVNDRLQEWGLNGASRRRAAVSSFGFSGTNAHLVIGEYQATAPAKATPISSEYLIPLSAKTADQLKQRAHDLLDFLRRKDSSTDLADMAYTLQVGREAMDERLGFVVRSHEQLADKLEAYLAGQQNIADCFGGQVKLNKEGMSFISQDEELQEAIIDNWVAQRKSGKLVKLWTKGLDLDWNRLYGAVKPRRIALPGYPFAKERYWIDSPDGEPFMPSQPVQQLRASHGSLTSARPPAMEKEKELFFEEYWDEKPAVPADPPRGWNTVILADQGNDELPSDAIVVSRPEEVLDAIRRAGADAERPVSVICTWARGRKQAGIHGLFQLFKAVHECRKFVSSVVLVGQYDPAHLDCAWDYSWIGFERSLKLVLPNVKIAILYTDTATCNNRQLADAQQASGVIWYRDGKRHVLACKSVDNGMSRQTPALRQQGAYLITGGCGALGMQFAHHLAQNYHAKLVLLGRSPLTASMSAKLAKLRAVGATEVQYAAVDIGDHEALKTWAETLSLPIDGVIHAAGVEVTRPFNEKSAAEIEEVLRPKTTGTLLLDKILQGQPLDFVCYFSSSAGILGDMGSCDYAIANRFQMAYGQYRSLDGRLPGKTIVINWPFWEKEQSVGMGSNDPTQVAFYLRSSGQNALAGADGIQIWQDLLPAERVQTLVLTGQPTRIEQFLARIYHAELPVQWKPLPALRSLPANPVPALSAAALKERLRTELRQLISTTLQLDQARLDDRANLADYGFDSISLAAFAKQLTAHFSLEITPALFFNHSSIQQLVEYFACEHGPHFHDIFRDPNVVDAQEGSSSQGMGETLEELGKTDVPDHDFQQHELVNDIPPAAAPREQGHQKGVAIIGMSGRFPKADSVDQLWTMLKEGRSGISEIPASRWNWRDYFIAPGHIGNVISTNLGGFIDGIDEFDPLFFEISPAEAEEMDPAERLLLMEAYRAIEDARISPAALRGTNVGVFVGMEESHFSMVTHVQGVTTMGAAMISSRLSYFLDLHGPTIATNTACSSGLVALHQAVMSLSQGECDSALVAGVALSLSAKAWMKMSEARMISQDGQCFSFSKKANGIGIGEAVVALMLKPLSAAIADGDHIYGTIEASSINFDGKTNGVTAPNGRMQEQLVEQAYARHNIDIRDVSHIVAHGTGTRLGDPVEVNALNSAFKKLAKLKGIEAPSQPHCALTSCKTNLGHTLAASGLVSLVALLKSMEHHTIPPSLYCEEENDYIDWRDSHFYVNKSASHWHVESGKPRIGAVSAFGRSGTNAHIVVKEYLPSAPVKSSNTNFPDNATVIVPLSARAPEQLEQKVRDLLEFIRNQQQVDLSAIAYTLQTAREAMEERLTLVVSSADQLEQALASYLTGKLQANHAYRGSVRQGSADMHSLGLAEDMQEVIEKWIARWELQKIARHWASGLDFDWSRLYGNARTKLQRIALPTYPFARESYWPEKLPPVAGFPQQSAFDHRTDGDIESIEDIISKIDAGAMDTRQAAAFLKKLTH